MSEKKVEFVNDDFDLLLQNELSSLAPQNIVVDGVTPWKKYMGFILWGIILSTINNNLEIVSYIGCILMILGLRGLQNDNKWFKLGYITRLTFLVLFTLNILSNATIWNNSLRPILEPSIYINCFLDILFYFCFWLGIRTVENKSGIHSHSQSPLILFAWRCIVIFCALPEEITGLPALIYIIWFLITFGCIYKVYKNLTLTGYSIKPTIIKIPNTVFCILLVFPLLLVFSLIYTNNHYPMTWAIHKVERTSDIETSKNNLASLGVPEHVINDLTGDEILSFGNSSYALIHEEDVPLTGGKEKPTVSVSTQSTETYELHMTQVALRMTDDNNTWKIISHFKWNENHNMAGIDAINMRGEEVSDIQGDIYGKLLYKKNGKTYSSEYYNISTETIAYDFLGTTVDSNEILAEFSFDKKADGYSGYITFNIVGQYGSLNEAGNYPEIFFDIIYFHQDNKFPYPAITPKDYLYTKTSIFSTNASYSEGHTGIEYTPMELDVPNLSTP